MTAELDEDFYVDAQDVDDLQYVFKKFNDWFDSMNANQELSHESVYKRHITVDSEHHSLWTTVKTLMANMIVVKEIKEMNDGSTRDPRKLTKDDVKAVRTPTIKNVIRTIEGIEKLFQDLNF